MSPKNARIAPANAHAEACRTRPSMTNAAIAPSTMPARTRAAEHRADERTQSVGEQDLAQVVVVARGGSACNVVHRFGEVVDSERNRGDEERRNVRESAPHVEREDRQAQSELLGGLA